YKTNPLNPDTDGGGMKDGEEVQKNMNPLLAGDDKPAPVIEKAPPPPPPPVVEKPVVPVIEKAPDTDGDGLSDKDEIEKYGTDPNKKDTDGDGLSDYDEVMKYMTNPLKVDTDGDGLSDYAEVMTHKTNPLVMDTDKGTVDDGTEVAAGTDPLDPKDDILDLHVGTKFSLDGIFFDTAKATIKAESIPVLEKAFAALNANPDVKVVIIGHTDNVGSASSNQTLSQNRANAVKDWLVAKGIAATRIRAIGKGEAEPRATNDTDAGRTLNRRIEFEVEN
ncbi:MAG: OmpA family protein, partial [Candidatus Cloacimonadaceae bacterium]|nr:OmpA family protein [Candidatus Cloacimonadaceae bacterium]